MWKPQKQVVCEKIEAEIDEKEKVSMFRFCEPPIIPNNGAIDCKAGKCKFLCDDGFKLNGFPSKMCVNKKWKPEKPVTCEKQDSSTPTNVSNTLQKILSSGCHKPILPNGVVRCLRGGKSCQFTCNPGYIMIGSSQTYCNTERKWSRAAPKCSVIENEELEIVEDDVMLKTGFSNRESNSYKFGNCKTLTVPKNGELNCAKNKCTFRCDEGYVLEGYHTKVCGKEGRWKPVRDVICRLNGK